MVAGSAASAEGLNYLSYGAGFFNLSDDSTSIDLLSGGVSADFQSGDLIFNGGLSFTEVSGDFEERITFINTLVGYNVTPDLTIFGEAMLIDEDALGSLTTYGVGAEYRVNALTFGIAYDDSNEDFYVSTTTPTKTSMCPRRRFTAATK